MTTLKRLIERIISLGVTDDCDDDERTTRRVLTAASLGVIFVVPCWGAIYIAYGEVVSGLVPIVYSILTVVSFVFLWRMGGWTWFHVSQRFQHLLLPFILMWTLGGFVPSSAVLIWALLAPLSALWSGRSREAAFWIGAFLALTVFSGIIDPHLSGSNEIPDWLRTVFFAANFVAMTSVIFLLLDFFVRQKDTMVVVMRRNRELESAYLQQEVSLRQSDKLATLGKLSAGLAHELNNPTAAAQQATHQLEALLSDEAAVHRETAALGLVDEEAEALRAVVEELRGRSRSLDFPDALERSDREHDIQEFLEAQRVADAWELAPAVVNLGLDVSALQRLGQQISPDRFGGAVRLLATRHDRQSLLRSLAESTGRIVDLVGALKSYTFMDQAPRQKVDVHEGIESTLLILQSRLSTGIEVRRRYADDLPAIDGYGSELNQVWTNILDNAIDALGESGVIEIATRHEGGSVVVELSDDGPGIAPEVLDSIFDPFVTTKAPGQGTGLGLNISHNIVTQKHGGDMGVSSRPGSTTFTVRLAIDSSPTAESPSG